MKRIISALVLAAMYGAGQVNASDALPFLKTEADARSAAMGGACSAGSSGAAGIFCNPSSAARALRGEASFSHAEWLAGMRNENLSLAWPLGEKHTLFGGARLLTSGNMNGYTATGERTGAFSAQEGAAALGVALSFKESWRAAAAVKPAFQSLDGKSAYTAGLDLGAQKDMGPASFGASVSNIGASIKLGSTPFPLPLILRAGAQWKPVNFLSAAIEAIKPGATPVALAAGAEGRFEDGASGYVFFMRAGYQTGRSANAGSGISAGAGILMSDLQLDYSFTPYGDLGNAHRLTLLLRFGPDRSDRETQKTYYKARQDRTKRATSKPAPAKPKNKTKKQDVQTIDFIW